MRAVEAVFSQTLEPGAAVAVERQIPDCSECVVVCRIENGAVAPTTPATIVVEIAYDTPPTLWIEAARLNGGVQPHDTFAKRIELDPLAAHVRVSAAGNVVAVVSVAALTASR